MEREFDRKIVLEDGSVYYGYGFGSMKDVICEIVFNISDGGDDLPSDRKLRNNGRRL